MLHKLVKFGGKARVIRHIRQIQSRDFSILASNCTGTLPYRFLDMPYLTPTINLFFFAPCYMKFVSNLDHYLDQTLEFVTESRYAPGRRTHAAHGGYPIGKLDDIEIHFMHYADNDDAADKWNRRKLRINRQRLIYSFTDRDLCTPQLMQAFDQLPGPKLLLTARAYPWLSSAIAVPGYHGQSEISDAYTHYEVLTDIDFRSLIDHPHSAPQARTAAITLSTSA